MLYRPVGLVLLVAVIWSFYYGIRRSLEESAVKKARLRNPRKLRPAASRACEPIAGADVPPCYGAGAPFALASSRGAAGCDHGNCIKISQQGLVACLQDRFLPPNSAFIRSVPVRFSHCDAGIVYSRTTSTCSTG